MEESYNNVLHARCQPAIPGPNSVPAMRALFIFH